MKVKSLIGSAVLLSSMAIGAQSAMAMAPNSTIAEACLNGDSMCNSGPTSAGISGGGFASKASVDGYTLHSYSEYRPYVEYPSIKSEAVYDEYLLPKEPYSSTSGYASVYQNFSAIANGSGQVNFAWDGTLFSQGNGLTAAFEFSGGIYKNGSLIESFDVGDKNPGVGSDSVDKTRSFGITFNQGDIISVRASLWTHVSKFREIILCELEQRCEVARAVALDEIYQLDPSAFADFSNTGSFSINARALQAVPVPAAVWFLGSALLGLFGFSRKKAKA